LRANGVVVTVFGGNLRFVSLNEGDGLAQPIGSARIGDLFRAIREQHVAIGAVAISVLAVDELAKIVLGKFLRLAMTLPFPLLVWMQRRLHPWPSPTTGMCKLAAGRGESSLGSFVIGTNIYSTPSTYADTAASQSAAMGTAESLAAFAALHATVIEQPLARPEACLSPRNTLLPRQCDGRFLIRYGTTGAPRAPLS
jgi:hypothetical protein